RNSHIASFSFEMPVLVWWLTTPLGCSSGSAGCAVIAVSLIGGSLLVGLGGAGGHADRLALGTIAVGGRLVAVRLGTVVRLGVVGRLVAPAEAGEHQDHGARGGQAEVEDDAVADEQQADRQDQRPVRSEERRVGRECATRW